MYDRQRTIAHWNHLRQAARFKCWRHQEHIGPCINFWAKVTSKAICILVLVWILSPKWRNWFSKFGSPVPINTNCTSNCSRLSISCSSKWNPLIVKRLDDTNHWNSGRTGSSRYFCNWTLFSIFIKMSLIIISEKCWVLLLIKVS